MTLAKVIGELQQRPCVGFTPNFHDLSPIFNLSLEYHSINILSMTSLKFTTSIDNHIFLSHTKNNQLGKQGAIPSQVRYRESRVTRIHIPLRAPKDMI